LTPARAAAVCDVMREEFGLSCIRVTGGEPLVNPDVVEWVRALARVGVRVAMSTNGQRMPALAGALREAGLGRVNFSLDALDAQVFRRMNGGDVGDTLAGIEAARAVGLAPIRTNTVVLRGWNEEEVLPAAEYALERGIEPRFLELMNIGAARRHHAEWFVSADKILARVGRGYELRPAGREAGRTAGRWEAWRGGRRIGTIGIISPESEPFCADCRRLRLSADGQLVGCLMHDRGVDIRPCFDDGGRLDRGRLSECVREAVAAKRGIRAERRRSSVVRIGG
jgi:cyclic pyranopterin phosphate synthase